jgi:two-component system sensor histidine kinase UhpB
LLFPGLTWAASCAIVPGSVEVARAQGINDPRPDNGWTPVTLPDIWTKRWSDYTGVAWYRMALNKHCQHAQDAAMLVERINMTGAVWVNQTQLWRGQQLTEPMSRNWNTPLYWQIPAALLQEKNNTIWIQVSGLSFHSPGLGKVEVGDAAAIEDAHTLANWMQKYAFAINLVISGVVGSICLLIWGMRRREKAFGWYGVMSILWVLFGYNTLTTSPWPFSTSLQVSVFNSLAFVLYVTSFCIFTWRFGQCRYALLEKVVVALCVVTSILLLALPEAMQVGMLMIAGLGFSVVFFGNCILYQFHAWKTRRTEDMFLAVSLLLYLLIGAHASLVVLELVETRYVFVALSGLVGMVFMFLMLSWVFVRNIRKIEHAAENLKITVEETTVKLTDTLQREHALEMQNVRLKERLQIAQDLHDGFGGALVRSITLVEQKQGDFEKKHYLSILKSIRDDLRQVIDNSADSSQLVQVDPGQWIAPIRHRFAHIFEELDIQSSWAVTSRWPQSWTKSRLIDLTRFIEEGLTNVIKHSHATHVWVELAERSDATGDKLILQIRDNGVGFLPLQIAESSAGIGMQSMMARIHKLGGTLTVTSSEAGTQLQASFYYPLTATDSILPEKE